MKILLFILLPLFFVNSIKALEPTPITDDKTKEIVDIVKQIVNDSVTPTPIISDKPKSYFGNITKISENTITLAFKNQTQTIQVSDQTTYIDISRKKTKLDSFKVGQEVLAMGYLIDNQILDCKRLVVTELKSVTNNNQTVTGQIVDISKEASIFTLTPNYNKNNPFQLKTDSKTKIVDTNNKTITNNQAIVNGNKIIAIIKPDQKLANTFYASKIIVLNLSENKSSKESPTPALNP